MAKDKKDDLYSRAMSVSEDYYGKMMKRYESLGIENKSSWGGPYGGYSYGYSHAAGGGSAGYACGCPKCRYTNSRQECEAERLERLHEENRRLKRDVIYYKTNGSYSLGYNTLSEPKKPMRKLTILAKKMLDPDVKILVKAGILDSELELTDLGTDVVHAQYLLDNKEKIVETAKQMIEDAKTEKEGN